MHLDMYFLAVRDAKEAEEEDGVESGLESTGNAVIDGRFYGHAENLFRRNFNYRFGFICRSKLLRHGWVNQFYRGSCAFVE